MVYLSTCLHDNLLKRCTFQYFETFEFIDTFLALKPFMLSPITITCLVFFILVITNRMYEKSFMHQHDSST